MENSNKFWKGILIGALVTAFSGLIIVGMAAGIYLIGRGIINNRVQAQPQVVEVEAESEKVDLNQVMSKMNFLQQVIDQYFLFDEEAVEIEDGIYKGFVYGLQDPYSVYYTAEDYEKLQESTEGVYCGIGAMVSQNRTSGIITIVKVFEGSPSHEAGMLPGDIIYKVGDTEATGIDVDILVTNYIKGEEGTEVNITVLRGEGGDFVDLTIKRRVIEVPTVEHQMMENHIGYISVVQFDVVTVAQFKSAIDDLQNQGMEKLVIDLRDNPGGILEGVVEMLDYILPEGLLVYTEDKNGEGEKFYSKDGHEVKLPMAVLINENSASASEVFAGAVKDFKWATLVGTKTFGKGIVQHVIPLGDGTAIKLTVSHYFTPSGFDLHGKGIEADVEVELNEELKMKTVVELEEDNQVQAAIEALK